VKNNNPKIIVSLACFSFLVGGIFNGAIGPLLGSFASQTHSTIGVIGGVITAIFLGAWIAQITAGPIADAVGNKIVLMVSMLMVAVGILGLTLTHSIAWMFFYFFLTGVGQGGMNLTTNVLVANAYPEKSTSYLNLLHFFFGLGAFSGPAIVSLILRLNGPEMLAEWIPSGLFVVAVLLYLFLYHDDKPEKEASDTASTAPKASIYRSPVLWMIGLMLLVYVGIEYGVGSWSTTLMQVNSGMSTATGALVTSAYWGVFTIGRLSGAFLSSKMTIRKLLSLTVTGVLVCGVAFTLLLGTTAGTIIALVAIGLCLGPIFPTTIALTTRTFSKDQGKAYGLVGSMSSIGGVTIPWIQGVLLEQYSALSFALFVVFIMVLMLVFYQIVLRLSKKHAIQVN